jgi:hypothetical protein
MEAAQVPQYFSVVGYPPLNREQSIIIINSCPCFRLSDTLGVGSFQNKHPSTPTWVGAYFGNARLSRITLHLKLWQVTSKDK